LVGIERSGPTLGDNFGKSFSKFGPKKSKNPIQKSKFSFFSKKIQVPGAWLNPAWNSEPWVKKRHCLPLVYSSGLICVRMR
jgi:hypothetical protein